MATKEYSIPNYEDVLTYDVAYGTRYAVKVLKEVWIESLSERRWIVQTGKIAKDTQKFEPHDGSTLHVYDLEVLLGEYPSLWTPDPVLNAKPGDILSGKDRNGKTVLLYWESEDLVHRLTPMGDQSTDRSSGSLNYYEHHLTGIKVIKTTRSDVPFSSIK